MNPIVIVLLILLAVFGISYGITYNQANAPESATSTAATTTAVSEDTSESASQSEEEERDPTPPTTKQVSPAPQPTTSAPPAQSPPPESLPATNALPLTGTPQPAGIPLTSSSDNAGTIRGSISSSEMLLSQGKPITIPGSGATMVLSDIDVDDDQEVALFEVRHDKSSNERFHLSTNATRILDISNAGGYAFEVRSVSEQDKNARILLHQFPKTRTITGVPPQSLVLPGQTITALFTPHTALHVTLERVDRHRAQIETTSYQNGAIYRTSTNWHQAGDSIDTPFAIIDIHGIDRASGYSSTQAWWAPHLLEFSIEPK